MDALKNNIIFSIRFKGEKNKNERNCYFTGKNGQRKFEILITMSFMKFKKNLKVNYVLSHTIVDLNSKQELRKIVLLLRFVGVLCTA